MTGWVLAAGILLAARLGRGASEASRFDLSGLQVTCSLAGHANMHAENHTSLLVRQLPGWCPMCWMRMRGHSRLPVQAEVEEAWAARGAALRAGKAATAEAAAAADARMADARVRAAAQAREREQRDASLKVGMLAACRPWRMA